MGLLGTVWLPFIFYAVAVAVPIATEDDGLHCSTKYLHAIQLWNC